MVKFCCSTKRRLLLRLFHICARLFFLYVEENLPSDDFYFIFLIYVHCSSSSMLKRACILQAAAVCGATSGGAPAFSPAVFVFSVSAHCTNLSMIFLKIVSSLSTSHFYEWLSGKIVRSIHVNYVRLSTSDVRSEFHQQIFLWSFRSVVQNNVWTHRKIKINQDKTS